MTTTSTPASSLAPTYAVTERPLNARPTVRDTVTQSLAMAGRALLKMRRNAEQFFDVTVQPLLFTAMFAYIFGGAISGGTKAYLPIVITGVLAQTALTASMATGTQMREDMDKGVFDRFKSLPIARIAPLVGPAIADLLRYAIAATLTISVGIAMGYRPSVWGTIVAWLLVVFAGWSLAWIFTWLGTVARSAQAVQGIGMMIMFPLTFLSPAFVPASTMPGWLQDFVKVNPVTLIIEALRDLMNDGRFSTHVLWAVLGCVVVIAIFLPLAVRSYSRKM